MLKSVFFSLANANLCTGSGGQLPASGDKISMNVGFENVGDPHPRPLRQIEINPNIPAWVDHSRDACRVTADQVGYLGQAFGEYGFEDHNFVHKAAECRRG